MIVPVLAQQFDRNLADAIVAPVSDEQIAIGIEHETSGPGKFGPGGRAISVSGITCPCQSRDFVWVDLPDLVIVFVCDVDDT